MRKLNPEVREIEKGNGFALWSVYFYLTARCNLKCRHCWIDPEYEEGEGRRGKRQEGEVKIGVLTKALREAKKIGLRSVKITGGEPFLYKDFLRLLRWLKKNNLNITIETNGTLIGKKEAQVIKDCGVGRIAIALDGSNAGIHQKMRGVKNSFERTMAGIKNVVEKGLDLQIIFSLWKGNKNNLEETIILAKNLGAKSFKINPVNHIARGEVMEKKGELLSIEEILSFREFVYRLSEKLNFRIILDIPPAFIPVSQLGKNMGFCRIKNLIGVLSDGSVSICGIGAAARDLIFGNIRTDSIVEIWKKNKVLQSIREDFPEKLEGICGRCIFRARCLGKCRAEAYWEEKSLFSAFGFCQQAYEKGLFPKTRMREERKE